MVEELVSSVTFTQATLKKTLCFHCSDKMVIKSVLCIPTMLFNAVVTLIFLPFLPIVQFVSLAASSTQKFHRPPKHNLAKWKTFTVELKQSEKN